MRESSSFSSVNLSDPRQDVHRERAARPTLNRFRVAEALLRDCGRRLSIVEIAGGAAEFSQRLRELGHRVTFVDLSQSNVARARELGFAAHHLDLNLGLPPLADASFDGAVMLEIIEHVVAAEQLLKEAHRVLKPGGFLILSTPNFAYWGNRLHILTGRLSQDEGYHYRFFTPSVLRNRLESAGFRLERAAHTAPAVGYNFAIRCLGGKRRKHIHVPALLAGLLAHTLFVRARRND